MYHKIRGTLCGLALVLAGYLVGLATAWIIISQPRVDLIAAHLDPAYASRQIPLLWEVWDIVETDFIGELPDSRTMTYGAIRGALGTLNDPYTAFIEPRQHQRQMEDLRGSFGGIGVTMRRDKDGHVLLSPMPDSPARRAGVQSGDILVSVEGQPITPTVSFDDVTALVRGPVSSSVTIQIWRGDPPTTHSFTIVRQEIMLPSVTWRLVEEQPDVGYIALSRFSDRSAGEIKQAIGELQAAGATRLIFDLRDNGGGLRQAGVEVASQFLQDGVVMYQWGKGGVEESFGVMSGGLATDLPLVVLVNHGTASAAEIVAGALRDNGRARLIGEPTFGKGSVQHIYDLSDSSSLHVTTAEWLTPKRSRLSGQGLAPDITVVRTPEEANAGRDVQLEAAIEALSK
ncbi:MAG: S41 family peptidase [Thermoflexales bacterium]|nr:S41 family peptidase [Thermoflexales bacterium]